MGKRLLGAAAMMAVLSIGTAANAAVTVSIGSGPNFLAFDNAMVGDHSGSFVSQYGPASWSTGPNSFATNTSVGSQYLQPQGDSSMYIFGTGESDATVSWSKTVTSIDIYWGSPDTYNTLALSNGDSITGSAVLALTGTSSGDNAGTHWITVSDTLGFNGFTAMSSQAAFEFDMAVPELSPWAMMGIGFAGLAFAGFRGRKSAISIA